LWIGWGSVGLTVAVALILVNVPGPLQTQVRKVDSLRRLTTITELKSSTGRVRGLIWQGAVDLISVHDPIQFPDGTGDNYNILRPLIGYGPESMYVAYNSFYPPELGHYESRTASPDRSHNETLDSLVITGVLGLAVYLFTFVSFFAWGFHWLGLLKTRAHLLTYIGLDIFFAVIFFLIAWRLEGAYLFAVAIPLGILVGTMVYLTVVAFRRLMHQDDSDVITSTLHPHAILIIGLMSGVIAHFVEINFGIAIAATRTTFWAFAAILVVLGLEFVPAMDSNQIDDTGEDQKRKTKNKNAPSGA
jgi:O-antigen ligase